MGMNIKNSEVHRLAREAAQLTGLSQTGAVEAGLRLLLEKHGRGAADDRQRRLDLVRELSLAWRPGLRHPDAISKHEDLYDETTGLPA